MSTRSKPAGEKPLSGLRYYYSCRRQTEQQMEQYSYIAMPRILLTDERFRTLSMESRVLYTFMLNRTCASSAANGWIDEKSRFYIICSTEELADDMSLATAEIDDLMDELANFGLIKIEKQCGQDEPPRIYVIQIKPEQFAEKVIADEW